MVEANGCKVRWRGWVMDKFKPALLDSSAVDRRMVLKEEHSSCQLSILNIVVFLQYLSQVIIIAIVWPMQSKRSTLLDLRKQRPSPFQRKDSGFVGSKIVATFQKAYLFFILLVYTDAALAQEYYFSITICCGLWPSSSALLNFTLNSQHNWSKSCAVWHVSLYLKS